ncbi:UTP--glucose-1-phosphate uridylyltransferase [Flavobacteriaceae bacterium F89]|uniref:UTP--glucose-1-phosphate uridylyltransferase n=1 Tax=Cerina litoralis TaxID=2874477 RepID=A0AAE3EV13_9FLAO|nr:sugar phosphate nucleotidyltransferase [Cerina litoralis]MCG2460241.1 UTP--glucose-1-phosphate uridylyltransferase [Cerina litoralis]
MEKTLLLMAAGRGSRYGKLKQFDGFGPTEEFLMEFSIYDAIKSGFNHIVMITQKDNVDFLRDYLSPRLPKHVKLDVVAQVLEDLPEGASFTGERPKPWGTAHAVWAARNVISNPFAVINADDYYGKSAFKYAGQFIENPDNRDAYGLMAYTLKDTLSQHGSVSRGVCQVEGNRLISVKERTKIEEKDGVIKDWDSGIGFTGNEAVSMNFWVCSPSLFQNIENDLKVFLKNEDNVKNSEIYLPFIIQEIIANDSAKVFVIPSDSKWFGVTYKSDKEIAVDELKGMTDNGEYPTPLWTNFK